MSTNDSQGSIINFNNLNKLFTYFMVAFGTQDRFWINTDDGTGVDYVECYTVFNALSD